MLGDELAEAQTFAISRTRIGPLSEVMRNPRNDHPARQIADTIRTLHSLPSFPGLINYLDTIDGFIRRFRSARVLPESATEDLFRLYGELAKVYPSHDPDLVASHNDLKPENILFDGDRVWLVDWEAAFPAAPRSARSRGVPASPRKQQPSGANPATGAHLADSENAAGDRQIS